MKTKLDLRNDFTRNIVGDNSQLIFCVEGNLLRRTFCRHTSV